MSGEKGGRRKAEGGSDAAESRLSVIVPCWNDARALADLLESVRGLRGIDELIVADASSADECRHLAENFGALVARCPAPNRGAQLNAGARLARGDVLLFQHADTEFTQAHLDSLLAAMREPAAIGGAFYRKFDQRHARLRPFESWGRFLTAHGGAFYGDQSMFVRRAAFERLGGFAEIALMEDVEFSKRLRRAGRVVVLDPPIASSPRHHARRGAWRTSIRNGAIIVLYHLGVSPAHLHRWYYRGAPGAA